MEADELLRKVRDIWGEGEPQARAPIRWIDMSTWDETPVPVRPWHVHERIPIGQPTLFSGEGAAGKSLLALHLLAATALGRDWIGLLPEMGPAWYFGAEDDERELHIRLDAIRQHLNVSFDELATAGFQMTSLCGQDAVLGAVNRRGIVEATELYKQLYEQAAAVQPRCIALDASADLFAGDEINRTQVRQFVGLLRKLAQACDGSVILLSHPSLTGVNTGTGLSGSTAWHNSVRARMYLTSPKPTDGEQPDTDLRELQFKKSNYGPISGSVVLRYQRGLYRPEAGMSSLDKAALEVAAEQTFLALLQRFTRQDRNVSEKSGKTYAPAIFATEPEANAAKVGKTALAGAMSRLFASNKIHIEPYGYPSKGTTRLAAGPKP
jgi:RecA-family ATPase